MYSASKLWYFIDFVSLFHCLKSIKSPNCWLSHTKRRVNSPLTFCKYRARNERSASAICRMSWKWSHFFEMCWIWQWIAFMSDTRYIIWSQRRKQVICQRKSGVWWEHISVSNHVIWVFQSVGWIWLADRQRCFFCRSSITKERREHIFDLFDEIPEELNTEEGNEVLNTFFDSADRLKNITLQQLLSSVD